MIESRRCQQCNQSFTPAISNVSKGMGKFCSHKCYSKSLVIPFLTRFWNQVNKNGPCPPHLPNIGSCWIWTKKDGSPRRGYGVIMKDKELVGTHRISWEIHYGPVPQGMCVLHKCDNRACVRPDHLFIGTKGDNAKDCINKGRSNRPSGEKHRNSIINKIQALDILKRKQFGHGPTQIAKETGISYWCVYGVWSRSTWKNLE